MRCEPGDLVRVRIPYVERATIIARPGLVLARRETGAVGALLWVLMITNAERAEWRGDIHIPDAVERGLVIPSKVRTSKISTAEERTAKRIGVLDGVTWREVTAALEGRSTA